MELIVSGREINIDTSKKPFSKGSEGMLFLKNGVLYKIYYENALNEGFGDKHRYHSYLIGLETSQIDLPNDLIFDVNGKYVGYTTELITRKNSQFKGISLLDKKLLLTNLQVLLNDINYLSDSFILLNDVSIFNFILSDGIMNIVDPGRYRISNSLKHTENISQFKYLLTLLLYLDLKSNKVDKIRKIQIFRQMFQEELLNSCIMEYFDKILSEYDNLEQYSIERIRYIK